MSLWFFGLWVVLLIAIVTVMVVSRRRRKRVTDHVAAELVTVDRSKDVK